MFLQPFDRLGTGRMGWATPVWRLSGYPYRRYGLRRLTTLARLHVRRLGSVTRCFREDLPYTGR